MNAMTFTEYQRVSQKTANYPRHEGFNLAYPVMGLCGEAGEVANEVKKVFRDDNGILKPERNEKILDECSDVLWYLAAIATELGVDLGDIATHNIKKLQDRYNKINKMVPTEVPLSEYEAKLESMKPHRESEK